MRYWRPLMVTFTCAIAVPSPSLPVEHRTHVVDRGVEPAGDVAVDGLEPARPRGLRVELGRELGAVGAKLMHLLVQTRLALIGFDAALDRGRERIERKREPLGGSVDGGLIAHRRASITC